MNRIPIRPANPERICWGCDKYCPADDLACGNGTIRTPHPCELFGDDWLEWERENRTRRTERLRRGQADKSVPASHLERDVHEDLLAQ